MDKLKMREYCAKQQIKNDNESWNYELSVKKAKGGRYSNNKRWVYKNK